MEHAAQIDEFDLTFTCCEGPLSLRVLGDLRQALQLDRLFHRKPRADILTGS
jgi:hypothetical protein